uniref:Uncharacterized protein n=1 Tax=Caenorhabditis japonica TaxID=281687 RepID=A0A8R1IPJ6_CAEJA
MSTDEPLDPALFSTPVDDEELDNLFSEVSEFFESNPPSASEADLETIETLKSILDDTKKQKRAVQKDLEQMRIYSDKFTVTNELLKRKISGLEAAEKQLEENTQLLKSLKANPDKSKGVQSRKSKEDDAIRRLKASANDFPAPIAFPLYPEYQTPQDTRPKSDLKEKNHKKLQKRVSIESGKN